MKETTEFQYRKVKQEKIHTLLKFSEDNANVVE